MMIQISKRRVAVFLLSLVALLVIGAAGYRWWVKQTLVVPDELVNAAMENTAQAQSYRYEIIARSQVDDQIRNLSEITGERAKDGSFHIKGVMVNSPIEIFQIGNTTYHKDLFTSKWIVTEGNNLSKMQVLITEINPLANFNFRQVAGAKYLGQEKVREEKCFVVECQPNLENQYLELFWSEFNYRLWIDRQDQMIRKAAIKAKHKSNVNAALFIDVQLYDYNQDIQIKPPR